MEGGASKQQQPLRQQREGRRGGVGSSGSHHFDTAVTEPLLEETITTTMTTESNSSLVVPTMNKKDPLLLTPEATEAAAEHHRRQSTVTNIAEVYRLVLEETAADAAATNDDEGEELWNERTAAAASGGAAATASMMVTAGAVANLCSATLGAGVLALPHALLESGLVVGCLILIAAAVATAKSIRILVQSADYYRCYTSYEELAEHVISKTCRTAVEVCMLIFCGGCAVAYLIAIGDILEQSDLLVSIFGGNDSSNDSNSCRTYATLIIFAVLLLPLSMLRSMRSLQAASVVGIASIGTLVFAAFVHYMTDQQHHSDHDQHDTTNNTAATATTTIFRMLQEGDADVRLQDFLWPSRGFNSVLTACPVFLFAFSCQVNVCAIYNELPNNDDTTADNNNNSSNHRYKRQAQMRKVTITAVCICALLYGTVSLIALADFGSAVLPNMLSNYKSNNAGQIMQVATAAMAFAVIMAFPLNIFPARVTLTGLILHHQSRRRRRDNDSSSSSATSSRPFANETLTAALLQEETNNGEGVLLLRNNDDDNDERRVQQTEEEHHLVPLQLQDPSSSLRANSDAHVAAAAAAAAADTTNDATTDRDDDFNWRVHIVTTLFLTGMTLALALILPNISVVFGLLGGTASAVLGFCVPGLLGIAMSKELQQDTGGGERQTELVVTSYLLVVGGVLVGFLTTGVTVYNTLHPSS